MMGKMLSDFLMRLSGTVEDPGLIEQKKNILTINDSLNHSAQIDELSLVHTSENLLACQKILLSP